MNAHADYELRQTVSDRFYKIEKHHEILAVQVHRIEMTLQNINQHNEVMNEIMTKMGEMIERLVVIEDAIERLQKGERVDDQGYVWRFNPEDWSQRIAVLETEVGRLRNAHDNERASHLEKIILEKDERIKKLETYLQHYANRGAMPPVMNKDLVMEMQNYI
jgi:hypothetical protein